MSLPPPKATAQDGDAFYVEGINPMSNGICREYDDSLAWGQNYLFGGRLAPQEFGDIMNDVNKGIRGNAACTKLELVYWMFALPSCGITWWLLRSAEEASKARVVDSLKRASQRYKDRGLSFELVFAEERTSSRVKVTIVGSNTAPPTICDPCNSV
uniref:Uncharacterized protein n=2 Tax=Palpitomonas bilix TaxID=652834 RepID=A0A7S3G011_9EUKA|mmetsp:Transcript_14291/g.36382  ORF Transcript_14291/g.36382 Transcript_14291/m.36382 type:complete len:156 (+) Transcript_14291:370-837(+)